MSQEDGFRSSLEDTITIAKQLEPLCKDVGELVGMLELSLTNDAQLKLVMNQVLRKK